MPGQRGSAYSTWLVGTEVRSLSKRAGNCAQSEKTQPINT